MKSLKSLLAVTAIVLLSAGCASVTDANLAPESADDMVEVKTADRAVFGGGVDSKPIIRKPDLWYHNFLYSFTSLIIDAYYWLVIQVRK